MKWHSTWAPETFPLIRCEIRLDGATKHGFIYHPHPETKPTAFHGRHVMEIWAPFVAAAEVGREIEIGFLDDAVALHAPTKDELIRWSVEKRLAADPCELSAALVRVLPDLPGERLQLQPQLGFSAARNYRGRQCHPGMYDWLQKSGGRGDRQRGPLLVARKTLSAHLRDERSHRAGAECGSSETREMQPARRGVEYDLVRFDLLHVQSNRADGRRGLRARCIELPLLQKHRRSWTGDGRTKSVEVVGLFTRPGCSAPRGRSRHSPRCAPRCRPRRSSPPRRPRPGHRAKGRDER